MKDRACNTIAEVANLCMVYILCFTALLLGELLLKRSLGIPCALILAAVLGYCCFLRLKVANFIAYFLLHLVPVGALIFVPFEMGKIELIMVYALFFFLDIAFWMKRRTGGFAYLSVACVTLNALAYLYADVKKNSMAMIVFFAGGILFFLLFYVRHFFKHASLLAKERTQDERMPYSDMLKNGAVIAFPFVLLSVAVMTLVKIDALDRYAFIVYDFVKKIVGFAMRIVLYVIHTLASLMMPDSDTDQIRVVMEALEEGDSNIVLKILSAIVYFVGLAAVLYVLVRIFIALIRLIPMSRNLTPQVIEESDMVEIRERIVKTEEENHEKLDKVRRRYKKTVVKAAKKGYAVNFAHTPRERAADMSEKIGSDIHELTAEYETVRYR